MYKAEWLYTVAVKYYTTIVQLLINKMIQSTAVCIELLLWTYMVKETDDKYCEMLDSDFHAVGFILAHVEVASFPCKCAVNRDLVGVWVRHVEQVTGLL